MAVLAMQTLFGRTGSTASAAWQSRIVLFVPAAAKFEGQGKWAIQGQPFAGFGTVGHVGLVGPMTADKMEARQWQAPRNAKPR